MWHRAQVVWSRGSVRLHTGELIGAGAGGVGLFSVSKNSLPSWSDRVFLATRAPKMLKHHKTEKRKKVMPPGGGMPPGPVRWSPPETAGHFLVLGLAFPGALGPSPLESPPQALVLGVLCSAAMPGRAMWVPTATSP